MGLFEELDELYPENREIGEFHMDAQSIHKEEAEEEYWPEDLHESYYDNNIEEDNECDDPYLSD